MAAAKAAAIFVFRACFENEPDRRVGARGLQETTAIPVFCRPGPLTGPFSKHALIHVAALYERRPRMEVSARSADFPGPVILA